MLDDAGDDDRLSLPLVPIAAILLLGVLAGGYLLLRPSGATPVAGYQTAPVARGDVTVSVAATGPIAVATSSPLSFKSAGRITEILVKPGDRVSAGQVLAREDPTDLQAALDTAQAGLAQAEASMANLTAGPNDAQRAAAQVAIQNAKAAATDAAAGASAAGSIGDGDVALAAAGVGAARTSLTVAQGALAAAQDQRAKTLAADQSAIDNAQKNLDAVRATGAANVAVLLRAVEKAKDDLWAAQTSRDGVCGQTKGSACASANASVGAAQAALDAAVAQVAQGQKQVAQQAVQAQAQLDAARTQLASDQAKQDAAVRAASGQVQQAGDTLTTARRSAADVQAKATATTQTSRAQLDQAQGAVATAQTGYDQLVAPPSPGSIDVARAQIATARAAVEVAQANLAAATLRAPFAGTVATVGVAPGQWVSGGTGPSSSSGLIQLADLDHLVVVAQVNEADMARLAVGNRASFTVSAFPGQTFTGRVSEVQPQGTSVQNVVLYGVTIAVDPGPAGAAARLLPGMTASATVEVDHRQNVLVVPSVAVTFAQSQSGPAAAAPTTAAVPASSPGPGTPAVVLVQSNGQVAPRAIRLGLTDGRLTEIVAGLQPGESVVVGSSGTITSGGKGS